MYNSILISFIFLTSIVCASTLKKSKSSPELYQLSKLTKYIEFPQQASRELERNPELRKLIDMANEAHKIQKEKDLESKKH